MFIVPSYSSLSSTKKVFPLLYGSVSIFTKCNLKVFLLINITPEVPLVSKKERTLRWSWCGFAGRWYEGHARRGGPAVAMEMQGPPVAKLPRPCPQPCAHTHRAPSYVEGQLYSLINRLGRILDSFFPLSNSQWCHKHCFAFPSKYWHEWTLGGSLEGKSLPRPDFVIAGRDCYLQSKRLTPREMQEGNRSLSRRLCLFSPCSTEEEAEAVLTLRLTEGSPKTATTKEAMASEMCECLFHHPLPFHLLKCPGN